MEHEMIHCFFCQKKTKHETRIIPPPYRVRAKCTECDSTRKILLPQVVKDLGL